MQVQCLITARADRDSCYGLTVVYQFVWVQTLRATKARAAHGTPLRTHAALLLPARHVVPATCMVCCAVHGHVSLHVPVC